jgi:tRNA nucleotidyltransferase (CCA-adding enzyme)
VAALDAGAPEQPLLRGRDLVALGMKPGPRVGEVLREVYERQLDGKVLNLEEARRLARELLSRDGQ